MYKFIQEYNEDVCDDMKHRIDALMEVDEMRRDAQKKNAQLKLQVKKLYEKVSFPIKFEVGNMVLMWNAKSKDKGKHGKFDALWLGTYLANNTHSEDSYFLQNLTGEIIELQVHGQFLKP